MKFCVLLLCLLGTVHGGSHGTVSTPSGILQYDEDWGYATVRSGAHTFWWLYSVKPSNNRPLILWLQGGPGASSTGFGNLEEFGPKDLNGNDRPSTWLQVADLVFVDNPVGAGFSYVEDDSQFTTNVTQIGQDLYAWASNFFTIHSEYKSRPFFIFCESYGGKMSAEFARVINKNMRMLRINFKGVALGDSWISAMDYVNSWGPFLHSMSYLDEAELDRVNTQAKRCQNLVDSSQWTEATYCWGDIEDLISALSNDVSWYNILKKGGTDDWSASLISKMGSNAMQRSRERHVGRLQLDALSDYMNGPIRQKLGIIPSNVVFGGQSDTVFEKQYGDFMKPNYNTVDELLSNGTNVVVFNGQLDLICDTPGTEAWMDRLKWPGMAQFRSASKTAFSVDGNKQTAGFFKKFQNLQMWYILRAGHMMSYDAPEASLYMVQQIIASLS